jgi:hypothetical protein
LAMFEKITEYMAYKGPLLCTPLGNGRYEKRYKRAESQRRSGPYSPSYLEKLSEKGLWRGSSLL